MSHDSNSVVSEYSHKYYQLIKMLEEKTNPVLEYKEFPTGMGKRMFEAIYGKECGKIHKPVSE